jgi:hypothetical protein
MTDRNGRLRFHASAQYIIAITGGNAGYLLLFTNTYNDGDTTRAYLYLPPT